MIFKPGDKVKRIKYDHNNAKVGKVYTITEYGGGHNPYCLLKEVTGTYDPKMFTLKTNRVIPWL